MSKEGKDLKGEEPEGPCTISGRQTPQNESTQNKLGWAGLFYRDGEIAQRNIAMYKHMKFELYSIYKHCKC